jgi:hypothetical protein
VRLSVTPINLLAIATIPLLLALAIYVSRRSIYDNLKLLIVLIPLQAFAVIEAGFTIPPIYLFLVVMIAGFLFRGARPDTTVPGGKTLLFYLCIAVIATVLAALWLKLPSVQFDGWMRFRASSLRSPLQLALTIFHFLPFFLIVSAVRSSEAADSLMRIHLLVGFCLISLGIFQMLAFVTDFPLKDLTWSFDVVKDSSIYGYGKTHVYDARVASFGTRTTFIETRFFADYLLSVVPISLAIWVSGSGDARKRMGFASGPVAVLLGIIVLFFTMSRSAWVIMVISFLVMSVWLSPRLLFKQIPIAAVVLIIVAGLFMKIGFFNESVGSLSSIITERLDTYHLVTDPRVTYLIVLFETFMEHPILGVGAGNFSYFASAMLGADVLISAHGVPWAALAEFGIVGFALLMTTFGIVILSLGKTIRRAESGSERAIMIGVFTAVVALVLNSFTSGDRPTFHLVFLLGIASAYSMARMKPENHTA